MAEEEKSIEDTTEEIVNENVKLCSCGREMPDNGSECCWVCCYPDF